MAPGSIRSDSRARPMRRRSPGDHPNRNEKQAKGQNKAEQSLHHSNR